MDTTPVDRAAAAAFEAAEARAWQDVYAAAPAEFAEAAGLGSRFLGGTLVLRWVASGRRYFSRTIGLGVTEPATPEALDDVLDGYERLGISMFLVQSLPHCEPPSTRTGCASAASSGSTGRIASCAARAVEPGGAAALPFEKVTPETADEWADFLERTYDLDTGDWLQRLIGRPGWHE